MDLIAPLAKTGVISDTVNLILAIPIGFLFGFGLFHSGFTDSRKIAWVFYFKDVGVPVVMFSAIVTGMLGLWGLGLAGFIDMSKMYFVPTYLSPVAVAGVLFGVGMVVGGYCPGTAAASMVTGKLDAWVFFGGFLIGSLIFGDFYPVWGNFYQSDYRGAFRLDQLFGISLGWTVFIIVVIAVSGSLVLRLVQRIFWSPEKLRVMDEHPQWVPPMKAARALKTEGVLVAAALVLGSMLAFFPSSAFIDDKVQEPPYYLVPQSRP